MTKYLLTVILVRLVVPAALLLSVAVRPFGLSLVYLLLFLLAPLVQLPDAHTIRGPRGKFLLIIVVASFLLTAVHIIWHIVLASFEPYCSVLETYPLMRSIGHNLGLVCYNGITPLMAIHYIAPEIVMATVSLLVYILVRSLLVGTPSEMTPKKTNYQRFPQLTNAGKYLCLLLIMASGIMRPSVTSGIYFLVFMGAATAWSLGKPLAKGFAVVCRCVMAIMAVHIIGLLAYQWSWLIKLYPPDKEFSRYFGLTQLVLINEANQNFSYIVTDDGMWATLASPLVILTTFYVLAIESRELFKPKPKKKSTLTGIEAGKLNGSLVRGVSFYRGSRRFARDRWKTATKQVRVVYSHISSKALRGDAGETAPLMNAPLTPKRKKASFHSRSVSRNLQQDSTGSVVVPDSDSVVIEEQPTMMDHIVTAIIDFFQILIRSSYIATTITMMAWSIMFHSWLTFVFLMWANVVWLCQDQRSFMLKTSPILVVYAMLLLLTQYVYGMNLTEAELPSNITEVNLRQIGVSRAEGEACIPLLIKSLFTCMFWITLRQRIEDIRQKRKSAVITDMAAPLQVTVSTAASVLETQQEVEHRSLLLQKLGNLLRAACARYWIYVVVIMLFVIGITGERMTIFRIIYMFFFLSFILMFQISWHLWRRLMYMFWIVVIIYSMINLILIYVYQFDNFSKMIEKYLLINEKLQHDLGLDRYKPADLFIKLLTPTSFLIITIMQVHYFHKDFMALSSPKTEPVSEVNRELEESSRRSPVGGASTMKDDLPPLSSEGEAHGSATDLEQSMETTSNTAVRADQQRCITEDQSRHNENLREMILRAYQASRTTIAFCIDKTFEYLDIHLIKVVIISLMLLCIMNVCAMHAPIMLIITPALWLNSRKQRICVLLSSILICIYFMAKMVYQIDYIQHSDFDVNCTSPDNNGITTYNNAEWLGFHKVSAHKPLVVLLKGYIGIIVVLTFYVLVRYRQEANRKGAAPKDKHNVMFPSISRKEADIDLVHCIKYLVNYGFYKFGVEVTLICLMGVIGSRMDLYSVLYAAWLLVLVSTSRVQQMRIWLSFTVFVTVLIPIQYMIAVGFLPQFCVEYPWRGDLEQVKHIRNWLFLPYVKAPHATKIIFDFFLLLFATRQLKVFKIESSQGDRYPGGSNSENIGKDWETPDFVNPVPDFLGVVATWLDILKRMVFLGMLWVTLAIMFMTGTKRVNLFSIGYLIGSFIFLWQGTDFYLRPKTAILQWWSWLLRYNVCVVALKTLLQIPGCLFSSFVQENACWLVQLLGIGCVDKFAGGNLSTFIKMSVIKEESCSVPQEDIGLAWDGVCFAFLILQRRLFHSYYFYRVIDESKATTVLASRGAELIEELRQKQMKVQEDQEVRILEKIKVKMERIKANQKKAQGVLMKEPSHHDRGTDSTDFSDSRRVFTKRHEVRDRPWYTPPASHQKAVRSGDYYMFDEFDDVELNVEDEEESDSDEELIPRELGFATLLSTVFKTDMKQAVNLRRASMPALRDRRLSTDSNFPLSDGDEARRKPSVVSRRDIRFTQKPERTESETADIDDSAPIHEGGETLAAKIKRIYYTVSAFISSILVSLTRHIMKYSRDYRYVSKTLSLEKRMLKEQANFGIGLREGSQMIWEPLPPTGGKDVTILEEQDYSMLKHDSPPILHLGYALWYVVLAHTDIVCYIMVFINQIQSATILSIPLPLMVFIWGTLTIPRPTKTFWVTLIAYTEVIVLIKSMFQFEILPWNQKVIPLNMPFTAPRIIGIERKSDYALYDLLLLLLIFFHRFMLKSLGLWKESTPEVELRRDMEYRMTPEDTKMVVEGRIKELGEKYIKLHDKTGPRHRLVDRLYHVHKAIAQAMRELDADRSDPRVARRAWQSLHQDLDSRARLHLQRCASQARALSTERDDRDSQSSGENSPLTTVYNENEQSAESHDDKYNVGAGPSKPSDDDNYKFNDDQEPIIAVTTTIEETNYYYPQVILLSIKRYLQPTKLFFMRMLAPGARVTADIYAYMFLCDFFNFLVVIFGFAAFGTHQGDGGVQTYLEENKVPIPFLVMLILQFALIVIDRALYLRKFMLGKILFQYALIIGVHVWMFFVLPFITERTFNSLLPPPMWYMVKCVYLLLSAYQIRCGYPRRIIGNFLCKSYYFLNMIFFRAFMAIPFLFELRTLMDWIWTDTSMTLMDWLKMEDIFASVFLLKCSRYVEDEFPQPRGSKKSNTTKYLVGGTVLAFVIAIIWFPLVFFAFGNSVGEPNPPTDVTVKLRIGPFLPVYQMSAQSHNIDVFQEQDYTQLSNLYSRDRTAQTFLSNYMYNDIAVVTINPNSTMMWQISPPELQRLEREASSNDTLLVRFTYVITHPTNAVPNPPTIEDYREVPLEALVDGKPNPARQTLLNMLQDTATKDTWLNVSTLFPKFLKVFNKGTTKPAYQLMPILENDKPDDDITRLYRDVQLRLERENGAMYWRVRENCDLKNSLLSIPMNNCDMLVMYTFNDKMFPETLNFISGSGIIGLYTTFVFLASRVLRGFFSGIYTKIMFDDLPNVNRVLQLCLDIYLVREALELALEEDLFAKLVFLYRSPETMIKWTRPKEEEEEQRALTPSR